MIYNSDPGSLVKVTPMHPESAFAKNIEGFVRMSFVIGEVGKARAVEVNESVGEPLEGAAVRALEKALYHPKFSGKSITVVAEFTLNK